MGRSVQAVARGEAKERRAGLAEGGPVRAARYLFVAAVLTVGACKTAEDLVLDVDQYCREFPERCGGTPTPRPTPRATPEAK